MRATDLTMRSQADPYLILQPRGQVENVPKKLLPYLATVRKASEWKHLGFSVDLDEYGIPVRNSSGEYTFSIARERDELIADAIRTGKKAVRHPLPVFDYVRAGCDLSEFANLPDDVAAYCTGNMLRISGKAEGALPYLQRAIELNPNEVRYREVYYPLRLQLNDISSIPEELEYYRSDMDSALHSGRFDEWVKVLIKSEEYEGAVHVISATTSALQDLVYGKVKARLYGEKSPSWYKSKKEQLDKKAQKYLERIAKLKNKKKSSAKGIIGQTSKPTFLGSDVVALVYNFTQRCFIGEEGSSDVDLSHELGLFRRLETGPISQVEAHQLPQGQRRLFRELLTQYIMFLEMNREIPFPPDFLSDSTQDQLGTNILEYICHYRWPFPQMLPK